MPRVKPLTSDQMIEYQRKRLAEELEALMIKKRVSKRQVAKYIGCTPSSISHQFRDGNITLPTLIAIATLTDADSWMLGERLKVR